jgi:hypothetical protein
MLDKNEVYSMPGSVVTKTVRSFMKTFMISIRKLDATCYCVQNFYVRALSSESAFDVGVALVGPYGYVVDEVINPGSDSYGTESTCSCAGGNTINDKTSYPNGNIF